MHDLTCVPICIIIGHKEALVKLEKDSPGIFPAVEVTHRSRGLSSFGFPLSAIRS